MDPALPFALIWNGETAEALLFSQPRGTILAENIDAVGPAIAAMREHLGHGEWLAGGMAYEAGAALEPRLATRAKMTDGPLLWFGRFGAPQRLSRPQMLELLEAHRRPVWVGAPEPRITETQHAAAVARVQQWIAAGDIYQANLTFPCALPFRGHPLALFARLFRMAHAPHAALVHAGGGRWWLSLSPELFFSARDGVLTARPMKGTARRGSDAMQDAAAITTLHADAKNRAENLMITDLLRNDLARVARPGSVGVPRLWQVETYPTLHQMTSTVVAQLSDTADTVDALRALFPCGSVTGAPKIRAMEAIDALEHTPRGIYCGSIGWLAPGGRTACFNVAIRTISIHEGRATLGLGSGIVADSIAADEWRECLLKARFLQPAAPRTLIETMRRTDSGILHLPLHLRRMAQSAARFGISFDPDAAADLLASLAPAKVPQRVRLLLAASGAFAVQLSPAPAARTMPLRAGLARQPLPADDWRLLHKSSERGFHDASRSKSGCDEVIYFDAAGHVTEGSFTSVFVEDNGMLRTPPLARGLLPGVLREACLAEGRAREEDISLAELRDASGSGRLFLGNALRGLMRATLAAADAEA